MRPFTTLVALTALALVPACTSEAATSVAGTYSVELDTTGLNDEQKQMMGMMKMGDCIINADGTWESSMEMAMPGMDPMKSTVKGTWKLLDGNKIEMVDTESDGKANEDPKPATGTVSGGVITLEVPGDGQMPPMKMKMTKK